MGKITLTVGARQVEVETSPLPVHRWIFGFREKGLRRRSADRWVLGPAIGYWIAASIPLLLAFACFVAALISRQWWFAAVGTILMVAGIALPFLPVRFAFDRKAGTMTRRWLWITERQSLADVLALQVIEAGWKHWSRRLGGVGFETFSYQLNLVLNSTANARINLLVHDHWEWPWEVGNQLADFLKVPMIDCVRNLHPDAPVQTPNWWDDLQKRRPIIRILAVIIMLISGGLALASFGRVVWQMLEPIRNEWKKPN